MMSSSPHEPDSNPSASNAPLEGELEPIAQGRRRGHHKIIIGSAPGVGKTYRMLQEAHHLKKLGVDVIIGYLETHGRQETAALMEGLELMPRKQILYKGLKLEEMDTREIILRQPQTVLIDELAHTNVRGSEKPKRYDDVEEILNTGINVISTVNIQHIESLNDVVSRITGVQVNERVPDSVIDAADEVVLVDISVEELQDRLKKGKIYPREKIEQSLNNFFKKGNLVALRELALREVANNVEEQAAEDVIACPLEPTGIHERIIVCISTHPNAARLIRRGYRIADRMCGELIVLFVRLRNKKIAEEYLRNLEKHQALTQELEGRFMEVEADNIVDAVVETARQQKATQIIVGESLKETGPFSFLKPPIPYQIIQKTRNVDVYIVSPERIR